MPEPSHERSSKSLGKKKHFLKEHPYCCFCGGTEPSATIDHVPPKACFPDGYWPEGFEFPACEACNQGSKQDDQIVGFYTQFLDFNESNRTPDDARKLSKLRNAISRNYPNALPDLSSVTPMYGRVGPIVTPRPVAFSMKVPTDFVQAVGTMERKLTHALYYRETGKPLTESHAYTCSCYQVQGRAEALTGYFNNLLPKMWVGSRTNIRNYGNRFMYKCGYKEEDGFFLYAAQFGKGLIVWGMVLRPSMIWNSLPAGPLKSGRWWQGGTASKVRVLLDGASQETHS